MYELPYELYCKIMYSSGVISLEAKIIKELDKNLIIPFDSVVYMHGGISYVRHLKNLGILKTNYDYIQYIYIIGL